MSVRRQHHYHHHQQRVQHRRSASAGGACIPVEDVAPLFQCCACSRAPLKTPATRCRAGRHLLCADCCRRAGDGACPTCGSPLDGNDEALEAVLRDLPAAACARISSAAKGGRRPSETTLPDLDDPAAHVDKLEEARRLAEMSADDSPPPISRVPHHLAGAGGVRFSYSPVACPYPCGRVLTGSGMFPHFEFHHRRVPVAEISLDWPHRIEVDRAHLAPPQVGGGPGSRRCQALYTVHLDARGVGTDAELTRGSATWRPSLLRTTRSCHSMLVNRLFVAALVAGRIECPMPRSRAAGSLSPNFDDNDDGDDGWILAVWASALYDLPDVSCTLIATAVPTAGDARLCPRSVSFSGPVSSMRAPQRPSEVFARGECLLVPPAMLDAAGRTNTTVTVEVAFHRRPPPDGDERRR